MQRLKYFVTDFLISTCEKVMLRQSRPGRLKQRFWRFFVHISTSRAKLKICNNVFYAWMCRSGVPSFSTIDQTMKMLGAKAFWEVFRIFFFFLKEFLKKNHIKG